MSLTERLKKINDRILSSLESAGWEHAVRIIAVTKTHPFDTIIDIYNSGIRSIGENRAQEAELKFRELPDLDGLEKRFIGHLQSNKVNKALELFDTVDSVDSIKLAKKIGKKTEERGKILPVLLEVNTSGEKSKSGFLPEDIDSMLECMEVNGIAVDGLMTIGPLTNDGRKIRAAFQRLREIKDNLNDQRPSEIAPLMELSMGMSGDYWLAVEEGSTQVRIGSALLGPRRT